MVIEWRGPFAGAQDNQQSTARLDELCELLHAMHTVDGAETHDRIPEIERNANFGMLQCLGWVTPKDSSNVGIVFQCPPRQQAPEDLCTRIKDMYKRKIDSPPLGDRFDLAFGACSAVVNIVAVGWAHRAVRSENMLIFDKRGIRNVYLVGFTYSRAKDSASEFSNLPNSSSMLAYRPPPPKARSDDTEEHSDMSDDEDNADASLGTPKTAAHDLYGLGIVLLEIGLWTTVEMIMKSRKVLDPHDFQRLLLGEYVNKLSARCGEIYCNVVRKCLSAGHLDDDESLNERLADIVAELSECRA